MEDQAGQAEQGQDGVGRRRTLQGLLIGFSIVLLLSNIILAWNLIKAKNDIQEAKNLLAAFQPENKKPLGEKQRLDAKIESMKAPAGGLLEGEIFIVTQGGQNYKLGLVEVGLFSLDGVLNNMKEKKARAAVEAARLAPLVQRAEAEKESNEKGEQAAFSASLKSLSMGAFEAHSKAQKAAWAARDRYWKILGELNYYSSGDYYFQDLPPAISTTKTNSEGRFSMTIPKAGTFVLAARAQRRVVDNTEKYFWLVKVSMAGKNKETILLSNDNLTSSRSPNSLVETNNW